MTDLLEQIVLKLYEGRKKKDAVEGEETEEKVTKRVPSETSPYGKIEKGTVKIRTDKSMNKTHDGKPSVQAKAAADAGGKETKKKKTKGPSSGYDRTTSSERAKRAITGDKEKKAMADAKKELETWESNKKAHKEAELKAARRAVARDRYHVEKREKEQAEEKAKSLKKKRRKEFFRSKAKKATGEK